MVDEIEPEVYNYSEYVISMNDDVIYVTSDTSDKCEDFSLTFDRQILKRRLPVRLAHYVHFKSPKNRFMNDLSQVSQKYSPLL